jgi:alkanesulfonate monooxygenase SsuD/methylene tetrahydromethanopterin reductase-like flavin-dependent oxidoreductase (luciferase family)
LALGGRAFDDVILHTYFTPETLQGCVKAVKTAAERAGRDPDSVRVWSCFATVGDHLPEQLRLKKTVPRPSSGHDRGPGHRFSRGLPARQPPTQRGQQRVACFAGVDQLVETHLLG